MDNLSINISRQELIQLIRDTVQSLSKQPTSGADEIVTEIEASLYIKESIPMLRTLTINGTIKHFQFRNKCLYRKNDLIDYLNNKEVKL